MARSKILRKMISLSLTLAGALAIYGVIQFIVLRSQNSVTQVKPVDTLVVLGAGVWPGEQPSPVLRDRLARAAALYREGVAKKIIVSGGVGRYPPAEAEVSRRVLVEAGVLPDDIILEATSTSTAEQARLIKSIAAHEGFHSIALVTSFYHERRAAHLFQQAGFTQIEDARCIHERFQDLNFWVARESAVLSLVFWWQWAIPGAIVWALTLLIPRVRRRRGRVVLPAGRASSLPAG
jgi:uncharacterized SAM-binding protein YcdF (DUF218 family)